MQDPNAMEIHREPGFVQIKGDNQLIFPDYRGNMMFNTLGNIELNPNTGLLFLDFELGSTLQLTGRSSIIWDINAEDMVKSLVPNV